MSDPGALDRLSYAFERYKLSVKLGEALSFEDCLAEALLVYDEIEPSEDA